MALREQQKDKLRRWIRVTMVFIAVVLLLFSVGIPLVNNAIALGVERELKAISLPPNSEYVESVSRAAKVAGNGNGMQYFGAILIKSDLELKELQNYYANYDCYVMVQLSADVRLDHTHVTDYRHDDYDVGYYTVYRWGKAPEWLRDWLNTDSRGH